jgi:hypothetical protein
MPVGRNLILKQTIRNASVRLVDLTTRKLALSNAKAVVADSQSFLDFSGIEDEEHSCTVVQRWNREDCIARKENDLLVDLPTRADLLPVDVPNFG